MCFEENLTTEFKREYTEKIKKEVIAFANTEGGTIYVGVDDDGTVVGLENPNEVLLRATNAIRDSISSDVTMFTNCQTEIMDGKKIVKITVQRGTKRPYYLKEKGLSATGVYVRQGSSSVPASESQILFMIKETDGDIFENIRSLNQNLTFKTLSKSFQEEKLAFGENQKISLGLMTRDKVYTNLGFLLSDQCTHDIKLAVFQGKTKMIFKDRKEFSGSVLKQLYDAHEFIKKSNKIHADYSELERIDTLDYPESAIREALINSIVHRDYSFSGSSLISIFDDRIEFLSMGGLVKGISLKDLKMGISMCRNQKLANIFFRLKLIEAYGTGIPKIFDCYKNYKALMPKIEVSDNALKITLYNVNYRADLNHNANIEDSILTMFKRGEFITRKDVQEKFKISQTLAGKKLKNLVLKEAIKPVGKGKNTKYVRYIAENQSN